MANDPISSWTCRILAQETKTSYDGQVRQPHHVGWIVASGRLKKVHAHQLRFATERERVVAEAGQVISTPWTFGALEKLIHRGEYDDESLTTSQLSSSVKRLRDHGGDAGRGSQRRVTSPEVGPRELQADDLHGESPPLDAMGDAPEIPDDALPGQDRVQDDLDPERLLFDQTYNPLTATGQGPLFEHEPFRRARQ